MKVQLYLRMIHYFFGSKYILGLQILLILERPKYSFFLAQFSHKKDNYSNICWKLGNMEGIDVNIEENIKILDTKPSYIWVKYKHISYKYNHIGKSIA